MPLRAAALVLGVVWLGSARVAAAGPFGGFSADEGRYLVDGVRVCEPITAGRGAPRCEKKTAAEVARIGFRKGAPQRGSGAVVTAQSAGTRLVVRSGDGKSVRAEWDSGDPVGAVSAVYLSPNGKLVAVEYETRSAGRSATQVVALRLAPAVPDAPAAKPPPGSPGARAPGQNSSPAPPDDPKATQHIRTGDRELGRKRWKKAEAEYRQALAAGDHPAARYGLAAALAGQNRTAHAIAELEALAASTHPTSSRWRVEARLGPHFARLQNQPGFRRAVGIERDPRRPPSAYERLVGMGGHWEQTGAPCQEPTVDLRLDRKSGKFQLAIRNRCQGDDETTRLAGTWKEEGSELVHLRFPNVSGPEEELECRLAAAPDRSAEDTLTCTLEDLGFTLRVVRR